jgi:hypothetical protein
VAQWAGGYSGNTHATRVADAESALKQAILALRASEDGGVNQQKREKVARMADRLLSARVRMLKARLAALRDASAQDQTPPAQLTDLETRLAMLQEQGAAGILTEFGITT